MQAEDRPRQGLSGTVVAIVEAQAVGGLEDAIVEVPGHPCHPPEAIGATSMVTCDSARNLAKRLR